jgi:hypothetical protein
MHVSARGLGQDDHCRPMYLLAGKVLKHPSESIEVQHGFLTWEPMTKYMQNATTASSKRVAEYSRKDVQVMHTRICERVGKV